MQHYLQRTVERIERKLDLILAILNPPKPTGFIVTITGPTATKDNLMAVKSAAVDQQFLDNGKVRITLTVVDANGSATDPATGLAVVLPAGTPPVTCVDSAGKLTFAVDPTDTSGFGLIQLGTPSGDTVGDVVTASTTLVGASAPISGSGAPFDIIPVAVTPDNPAGFAVVESQA
jgi:hypothetical protein